MPDDEMDLKMLDQVIGNLATRAKAGDQEAQAELAEALRKRKTWQRQDHAQEYVKVGAWD